MSRAEVYAYEPPALVYYSETEMQQQRAAMNARHAARVTEIQERFDREAREHVNRYNAQLAEAGDRCNRLDTAMHALDAARQAQIGALDTRTREEQERLRQEIVRVATDLGVEIADMKAIVAADIRSRAQAELDRLTLAAQCWKEASDGIAAVQQEIEQRFHVYDRCQASQAEIALANACVDSAKDALSHAERVREGNVGAVWTKVADARASLARADAAACALRGRRNRLADAAFGIAAAWRERGMLSEIRQNTENAEDPITVVGVSLDRTKRISVTLGHDGQRSHIDVPNDAIEEKRIAQEIQHDIRRALTAH